MKKYRVIDLQGENFMDDTHQEPMTLQELKERFLPLYESEFPSEKIPKHFTGAFIEDLWEVKFEEVN